MGTNITCGEKRSNIAPLTILSTGLLVVLMGGMSGAQQADTKVGRLLRGGMSIPAAAQAHEVETANLCEQAARRLEAGEDEAAQTLLARVVSLPVTANASNFGDGVLKEFSSLGLYMRLGRTLESCAKSAAAQGHYGIARENIAWCRRLSEQALAVTAPTNSSRRLARYLEQRAAAAEASLNQQQTALAMQAQQPGGAG